MIKILLITNYVPEEIIMNQLLMTQDLNKNSLPLSYKIDSFMFVKPLTNGRLKHIYDDDDLRNYEYPSNENLREWPMIFLHILIASSIFIQMLYCDIFYRAEIFQINPLKPK